MQHNVFIPSSWPSLTVEANQAFNLTSFALSLLLVFRQASSSPFDIGGMCICPSLTHGRGASGTTLLHVRGDDKSELCA